jgi:Protein of unknown function (DUF3106)
MKTATQISVIALAAVLAVPAFAQGGGKQGPPPGQRRAPGYNQPENQDKRRPGPHFGEWLRRNLNTPPEQKEKALENDPNFKNLPPDRQDRLKQRLQKFNALPPDQQQRILSRMETWEHMTPEQHQKVRSLFDRMRAMPEERRSLIRDQFRSLASQAPDQRQRTMNSDQFKHQFSDDERNVLSNWLELRDTNSESASPSLDDPQR